MVEEPDPPYTKKGYRCCVIPPKSGLVSIETSPCFCCMSFVWCRIVLPMPWKEATAWFGLTILGVGAYGWYDGGERVNYAIAMSVVGLLVTAYGVYAHEKPGLPKLPVWMALLLLTWGLVGYDIYLRSSEEDIWVQNEKPQLIASYGHATNASRCEVVVNGKRLLRYQRKYKVSAGCFVYDGQVDEQDNKNIRFTNAFDIRDANTPMDVQVTSPMRDYILATHGTLYYFVLLVPKDQDPTQFSTLRVATNAGAKTAWHGGEGY